LRAGFICSAIISANSSEQQRAVFEDCAMIAGWRPYQWAQMKYVKESQTRTVVSTRVVRNDGMKKENL
jgi:hypothetical protein